MGHIRATSLGEHTPGWYAECMAFFQHPFLAPLYQALAQQRQAEPDDISAANVAAQQLLQSPYLGTTYHDWHLLERAPGEWRLYQRLPDHTWVDRDPLNGFYRDPFLEEEQLEGQVRFTPTARPETLPLPDQTPTTRPLLPDSLVRRAHALLEGVRQHDPNLVDRLLQPEPSQATQRQHLVIEALNPAQLGETLYRLLGPWHDPNLRAYGIDYHTAPTYHMPNTTRYLLAHNGEEIAGLMKLGNGSSWGYGVGYVCVASGFRNQRLSQRLYQAAIDLCLKDEKVLIRSDPGDHTPRQATLAYDRLVLASPVLHTTFHSPAEHGFKLLHDKGVPYTQWAQELKQACDAAIRTPEQRLAGDHVPSYQQRNDWVKQYGKAFEELLKEPRPQPRRPRP